MVRDDEGVKVLKIAKRDEEWLTYRVSLTIDCKPLGDETDVVFMDSACAETEWNLKSIRADEEDAKILKDGGERFKG